MPVMVYLIATAIHDAKACSTSTTQLVPNELLGFPILHILPTTCYFTLQF